MSLDHSLVSQNCRPDNVRKIKRRPPQTAAGSLESEIEKFLQQARNRGPEGPKADPGPRPQLPPRPPAPPVPAAQPVRPGDGFGQGVASHVKQHMGTDRIAERDAHLAETIELADERVEQHLESVFNHDVGQIVHKDDLASEIAEGTDVAAFEEDTDQQVGLSTPAAIREMLQSPEDIRKVFIVSEILRRPEI